MGPLTQAAPRIALSGFVCVRIAYTIIIRPAICTFQLGTVCACFCLCVQLDNERHLILITCLRPRAYKRVRVCSAHSSGVKIYFVWLCIGLLNPN